MAQAKKEKENLNEEALSEAFEKVAEEGFVEIPLQRTIPALKKKVKKTKLEATDEELAESEAIIEAIVEEDEETLDKEEEAN